MRGKATQCIAALSVRNRDIWWLRDDGSRLQQQSPDEILKWRKASDERVREGAETQSYYSTNLIYGKESEKQHPTAKLVIGNLVMRTLKFNT